jgi:hypothetical protein
MRKRNPKVKIDANLLKELEQADKDNHELQVVFTLRPPNPEQKYLTAEQTQSIVKKLLAQVEGETGEAPRDSNVFKNLGSFVVVASANFIRKLLEQDEIASAIANRQPGSLELSSPDKNAE